MTKLFIYLSFLLLVSCGGDKDNPNDTPGAGAKPDAKSAFTCVCDKGGNKENIGADNIKKAESQCTAKGTGYQITSCKKKN